MMQNKKSASPVKSSISEFGFRSARNAIIFSSWLDSHDMARPEHEVGNIFDCLIWLDLITKKTALQLQLQASVKRSQGHLNVNVLVPVPVPVPVPAYTTIHNMHCFYNHGPWAMGPGFGLVTVTLRLFNVCNLLVYLFPRVPGSSWFISSQGSWSGPGVY